jgi:hypothetical protein
MAGARSHRKTGTHFSGSRSKTWNSAGAHGAQKGSPAEGTGQTLLVAAQYSQKTLKNNGLLAAWLTDFPSYRRHFGRCRSIRSHLKASDTGTRQMIITPKGLTMRPAATNGAQPPAEPGWDSAMPLKMTAHNLGRRYLAAAWDSSVG